MSQSKLSMFLGSFMAVFMAAAHPAYAADLAGCDDTSSPDWKYDVGVAVTSFHKRTGNGKTEDGTPANEFNYKGKIWSNPGVTFKASDCELRAKDMKIAAGYFRNSMTTSGEHYTGFLVSEYLPLKMQFGDSSVALKIGGIAGLGTGYRGKAPKGLEVGGVTLIAAPKFTIGTDHFEVDGTVILKPAKDGKSLASAVLALSLDWKFN